MHQLRKIIEHRGLHRKEVGIANKVRIIEWLASNPTGSMTKCQKDLNLSSCTVRKHMRAIGVK